MHKFSLTLALLFSSLTFVTCGGEGGDGAGSPAPQEEEDTGGTTGSGSSGGRGGGTSGGTAGGTGGGGGSTCLSTTQRDNIRSVLNRAVAESGGPSTLTIEVGDPGSTEFFGEGSFELQPSGSNRWAFLGGFCSSDQCSDYGEDNAYSFKNGCFYSTSFLTEIRSALANEFTVTYLFTDENGIRTRNFETWSVSPSGRVKYQQTTYQDGAKQFRDIFQEL